MSLDRAKSNGMRLFVVEHIIERHTEEYMNEWLQCEDIERGEFIKKSVREELDSLDFVESNVNVYTSITEAFDNILSLLNYNLRWYFFETI